MESRKLNDYEFTIFQKSEIKIKMLQNMVPSNLQN